jgi:hypothetical protein
MRKSTLIHTLCSTHLQQDLYLPVDSGDAIFVLESMRNYDAILLSVRFTRLHLLHVSIYIGFDAWVCVRECAECLPARVRTQLLRTPYASKRHTHPAIHRTPTCTHTNLGFLVSDFHGRPVNQIRLQFHVFVYVFVRACTPVRITIAHVCVLFRKRSHCRWLAFRF